MLDLLPDGSDLTRVRNLFDQSELANRVLKQMKEVSSLLTSALNIHLNVEQQFTLNTSNVLMTFQTLNIASLPGTEIPSLGNARLRLPSSAWNLSLQKEQIGSLRVRSSSDLLMSLDFSLSSVELGTFAFVWFFIEDESLSLDLLDLDGSTRKCNSSSHGSH